jgi:hypothetical protein
MKISRRLFAPSALVLTALVMCVSGCVVRDREVVRDPGYAQGYREGYYDRDHNRYWHEKAWHDCVADDVHCH